MFHVKSLVRMLLMVDPRYENCDVPFSSDLMEKLDQIRQLQLFQNAGGYLTLQKNARLVLLFFPLKKKKTDNILT